MRSRFRRGSIALLAVFPLVVLALPQTASAASGFALSKTAKPYAICPEPATTEDATCEAIAVPTVAASSAEAAGPELEGSGEKGGFDPKDLHEAYKLPEKGGKGTTIAIVDAYNDPYAESDLEKYREKYKVYYESGVTACTEANGCFKKVNQKGETKNYPANNEIWSGEISLDLDMVSAACAECKILLVEANGEGISNLGPSDEEAETLGATVISNSWNNGFEGEGEKEIHEAEEKEGNKYFDHEKVPILFSGGDYGYSVRYPAVSQYVIAVGGTKLKKTSEGSRKWTEEVWSNPEYGYRVKGRGTGSGCSKYEPKPKWQTDKACTHRIQNDIAAVASPQSPVSIYDTYEGGWANFGGTSASSPFVAGVEGLSTSHSRSLKADAFYAAKGSLFDVTKGSNGTCTPPTEDEYFCTAEVGYDGPTGNGAPDTALTLNGAPAVTTEAATSITKTGATLNGSVNPEGLETKYYFEYGTTESYGTKTAEASAGSGTSTVKESKAITGLVEGTTYYFRIVATNSNGTTKGSPQAFTTTSKPSVETKAATSVSSTEARLNGIVNPHGEETKYAFEYGETTSYGTKTPEASAGSGTSNVEVSKTITSLKAETTYHFRIVATNGSGTTYGSDKTFTTLAPSWSVEEPPSPTGAEQLYVYGVSCTSSAACTSVGSFHHGSSEESVPLAEFWNGTAWLVQEPPTVTESSSSGLRGVSCTSSEACIAVGAFLRFSEWHPLAEKLEGTKWSVEELPLSSAEHAFLLGVSCTSATVCMAVGEATKAEKRVAFAEKLEGTKWAFQELPSPAEATSPVLKSVSCTSSTACIAVGTAYKKEKWIPVAEHWNGTTWAVQEPPYAKEGELDGVSCRSSEECFAVGETDTKLLIERLTGTTWSIQEAPVPAGETSSHLLSVSCPTSTSCMAIGGENKAGTELPLAERWNGTAWSLQEPPNPTESKETWLDSISCTSSTVCTAAGTFENASAKKPLVESYH